MKTGLPSIRSIGQCARRPRRRVRRVSQGSVWLISDGLLAVGAPDHRTDAGVVARSDHGGAGAVGEDEGGGAVGGVGHVAEPLDADDQHVLGRPGADERVRHRRGVAEAGAGGGDVEGRRAGGAQLAGDRGGDGRGLVQVGDGGDDHRVDLAGLDAGRVQRLAGGGDRHHLDGLVGRTPSAARRSRSGSGSTRRWSRSW